MQPGEIRNLDTDAPMGEHQGLMYHTLGQRDGLGIGGVKGAPELPWYVAKKDMAKNVLYVVQGHDHPALGAADQPVQVGADLAFRRADAGNLGVGRIAQEQIHPGVAEPRHAGKVGGAAVQRQLVELDVTGVQDGARSGVDRDRQGVRDGVVDREVLALEDPVGAALPLGDLHEHRLDAVLATLGGDQRAGEFRTDDRDVGAQFQQERDGADVVLVRVGEHQRLDVLEPILDEAQIRQDEVDPGLVVGGEQHTAVDDQQSAQMLENRHVAADLADSTQRGHPQPTGGQRPGR